MIKRWISKITGRGSNVAAKTPSEIPERIDDLLRTPGRACTATLHSVAQSLSKEDFLNLVHCPSLVGTAVREGELGKSSARIGDALNNPTFLFTAAQVASFVDGVSIEESIFLLRKEANRISSRPSTHFAIGRAKTNDIRIVDFAISRSHALIESTMDGYKISDCDSRNGTKVNGRTIRQKSELLSDRDTITLGRYEFSFLLPETLYERLRVGNQSISK